MILRSYISVQGLICEGTVQYGVPVWYVVPANWIVSMAVRYAAYAVDFVMRFSAQNAPQLVYGRPGRISA